jgi:hypothetical protein
VKVIGKTESGFIIEASKEEIANLTGYHSSYSNGYKSPLVGVEIQVSKMFRQLYDLEHNQPELQKVVNTLRGMADLLEPVCPVIEKRVKEAVT